MATVYYSAASLDGYVATEDHDLGWLLQFGMPADSGYDGFVAGVGALAMGSATYEWLCRHLDGPWPYAQPTWVFSTRTLPAVPGAELHFVHGDVRPVHAAMQAAAGAGDVWVMGGGQLAAQFADAGLIDELVVQVAPVLLGSGRPLLPRRFATPPLALRAMRRFGDFVELRYTLPR